MKTIKDINKALLSGMFIGFGGLAFIISKAYTSNPVLSSALFPFGLYLICILGLNLYTGKIGFVFEDKSLTIPRLLIMVLFNLIGASLIGLISYLSFNKTEIVYQFIKNVVSSKLDTNIFLFFLKSIVCGSLVYLAVKLFKLGQDGFTKFIGVFIPIFLFVLFGFEHCIADMFYFAFALSFDLNSFLYILVSIIGNSIGAIIFYFLFYIAEKKDNEQI